MSNRSETTTPARDRAFTAAFALWVSALGCAILLISVPRPVPLALPVLELPRDAVQSELRLDRELASRAPSSPAARELYALVLDAGREELAKNAVSRALFDRIKRRLPELRRALGEHALFALRSRATDRFMLALSGELDDVEEARGLLGSQPMLFVQHGYMLPSGTLLAPELSVRASYKVRWNMILGAPSTEGLRPLEVLAHEGFRGLEARGMPSEVRTQALTAFAEGGGKHGVLALAIWRAGLGDPSPLVAHARSSHGMTAPLRIRNMALAFLPLGAPDDGY